MLGLKSIFISPISVGTVVAVVLGLVRLMVASRSCAFWVFSFRFPFAASLFDGESASSFYVKWCREGNARAQISLVRLTQEVENGVRKDITGFPGALYIARFLRK